MPVLTVARILAVDWALTQQYSSQRADSAVSALTQGGWQPGIQGSLLGQPEGILGLAQTGATRHFYFVSSMINLICFRFWESGYILQGSLLETLENLHPEILEQIRC